MVFNLIKRAFGLGKDETAAKAAASAPATAVASAAGGESAAAFVEYVVRELVDDPSQVVVTAEERERQLAVLIRCAKPDMGKVIGRKGKTIASLRALVNGTRQDGRKVSVDVLD